MAVALDIVTRLRLLPTLPTSVWRSEAESICGQAADEILLLRERESRRDTIVDAAIPGPPLRIRQRPRRRQETSN